MAEKKVLPAEWVAEDKRLQDASERAGAALGELRWRGTLDPDGPGLTFYAYGKQVGVRDDVIGKMAKAHEMGMGHDSVLSFYERYTLAGMAADRAEAFKAIGKVEGRAVTNLNRDAGYKRMADDIRNEIVLEREAHIEAGEPVETFKAEVVALEVAERRKEAREIARRVPVPDDEPTGLEWGAVVMDLEEAEKSVKSAVKFLNQNNRFTDKELAVLKRRLTALLKAVGSLEMAFEALDTDTDALIGALVEGS